MRLLLLLLTTAIAAGCAPPPPAAPASTVVRYSVEGKFDDVREDVKNAIVDKGLVIDNTSRIAAMLQRTGKDVGSSAVMFGDGQGVGYSFCSAVISRKTMEADAHNIAFCPYTIVVYSTAAEPNKVYAVYQRAVHPEGSAAAQAALQEVDALLDGIVRDALRIPAEKK